MTDSEWKRINDIALIIHSEKDINSMRNHFFEAISVLIPYEKAMFYLIEESEKGMQLMDPVFVNVDEKFASHYEMVFREFRYGRVAISARKTMAFNDTDLMSDSRRVNTDMFKSFMQPYYIPYGAGIEIAKNRKPTAEISFFRTEEQGNFSKKEMDILDVIKDHLEIRINGVSDSFEDEKQLKTILIDYGLTQREIEVVSLVEEEYSIDEIAEDMGISRNTAKRHLHNIYEKLNLSGRMALISFVSKLNKTIS